MWGHFKQALDLVSTTIDALDEQFSFLEELGDMKAKRVEESEEVANMRYFFVKMFYSKAKLLRKTRQLNQCDQTCQFLIDMVKEEEPKKIEPKKETPVEEPKTEEIKDEDKSEASPEKKNESAGESIKKEDLEPQKWWKFAIKASYVKAVILA